MTRGVRQTLADQGVTDARAIAMVECYDLQPLQGSQWPSVLIHNDEGKGEWSAVFRDIAMMWPTIQSVPETAATTLHKVKDGCVTSRHERL
eukprot:3936951-Rhodomonas_salina.1